MNKLSKVAVSILLASTSTSISFAKDNNHSRRNQVHEIVAGAIILGTIGVIVNQQRQSSNQNTESYRVYVQPSYGKIPEPYFIYEPPRYDPSIRHYIYKPPRVYDRYGTLMPQADIYIPANKHYYGCNFYDYDAAAACIQYNDSLNR